MAFSFKSEKINGIIFYNFIGKLTNDTDSQNLNLDVDQVIASSESHFIFNLSDLTQCNSSGLNAMIRTLTKARIAKGDLVLCNLNEALNNLFTITKINEIFSIYSCLEDAKKHFKNQ